MTAADRNDHRIENDATMLFSGTAAMIDVTGDIQSMTTFKRNSVCLIKRMRKTGRPLVLTVKGKAEVVVMGAAAYQEIAERADAIEGIRRGLAQVQKGLGRPVDEVFDDLERLP